MTPQNTKKNFDRQMPPSITPTLPPTNNTNSPKKKKKKKKKDEKEDWFCSIMALLRDSANKWTLTLVLVYSDKFGHYVFVQSKCA